MTSTSTPPSASAPIADSPERRFRRFTQRLWLLAVPLAALSIPGELQLLRVEDLPQALRYGSLALCTALQFSVAFAILWWGYRFVQIDLAYRAGSGQSEQVSDIYWRLGLQRGPARARRWGFAVFGGIIALTVLRQLSFLPPWLHLVLIIGFLLFATTALWQQQKITDEESDELSRLIRYRAERFALYALLMCLWGVDILNRSQLLPDYKWEGRHLGLAALVFYLVGAALISRRYR